MSQKKTSEIRFKVTLDEQNIPCDIKWQATDSAHNELKDCKSMMVSVWDPIEKQSLNINLWTNEMMVDEMHAHFFQSLMTMAQSYNSATGNPFVLKDIQEFVNSLSEKTKSWEEEKKKG